MTQYSGKIIRRTPVTPTQQTASGVWTHSDVTAAVKTDSWPVAGVPCPISRSLRFRASASAYLSRTPAVAGNGTTWTFSCWVKRGSFSNSSYLPIFSSGATAYNAWFGFSNLANGAGNYAGDSLVFSAGNGSTQWQFQSIAVFRDPSAWYHIVLRYDSSNATAANRVNLYVNGVLQAWDSSTTVSQNYTTDWTAVNQKTLWSNRAISGTFLDGYLAEVNFIDGQALTPTAFATTDSQTGAWIPMQYTGTYGANGFRLNFRDNSSLTAIAADVSGNGNNWTTNNISLTNGTTYDSMLDVPTQWIGYNTGDVAGATRGNYAVLNPMDQHGTSSYATVANGNLYWYGSYNTQNGHGIRSTLRVPPTGKWYVEAINVTYSGSGNSCMLGFTSSTQPITATAFSGTLSPWVGVDASVFNNTIRFYSTGVSASLADGTTLFATCSSGDVVSFAFDLSAGKIWIGKNGAWYNSGDPVAGTNATSTFDVGSAEWAFWGEYVAASNDGNRSSVVANFGQRPFAYTPPAGFRTLCSTNLPVPSIVKGNQHFDVVARAGATAPTSVTSLAFTPDFLWTKTRNAIANHNLFDSVRGLSLRLQSDNTGADAAAGSMVTSFNSNGYTFGSDYSGTNLSGNTHVDWVWRAGGAAVSNTAGTITSQVSANVAAGFSIVTYTGTGANATVGHGLGVAPKMVIVKFRNATSDWVTWHTSFAGTEYIALNLTNAKYTAAPTIWNSTTPTSTVFSVGISLSPATNAVVAYCFAEVAGYSKFGSYTGNGSADGPFVFCGFRPRYVLVKRTDVADSWQVWDTARDPYNVTSANLYPNLSNAEVTDSSQGIDIVSNGFKLRTSNVRLNASGGTYIYAAFAETPFKYSNAR